MFFCLYFYLLVFMTLSLFLSYLNSISRYHLPSQFMLSPQSMAYLTESPSCYIFLIHVSRSTFFLSLPSPSVSVLYEISSRPCFLSLRFVIINSLAHLKCTFHTSNPSIHPFVQPSIYPFNEHLLPFTLCWTCAKCCVYKHRRTWASFLTGGNIEVFRGRQTDNQNSITKGQRCWDKRV